MIDVVVEHVFRSFAEIDDPFSDGWGLDTEGHVLRIDSAGGMVVAANTADAAGDEVSVTRVFAFHENAVAAKYGRSAVAFGDFAVLKIDLREDSQTAHDPRDRIPVHFD